MRYFDGPVRWPVGVAAEMRKADGFDDAMMFGVCHEMDGDGYHVMPADDLPPDEGLVTRLGRAEPVADGSCGSGRRAAIEAVIG